MAQTTQKKATAHFESLAKNRKLDFLVDSDFANTGVFRYQEGFQTVLSVKFAFQTNYADFHLYKGGMVNQHGGQKHYVQYDKVNDWNVLWSAVVQFLGPEKKED